MNTFPLSPLGSVQINTMNTKLFLKHKLHLQLLLIYTEHFFFCFIKLFQFKTASVRLLILHCDCIKTVYSSTSAEEKQFLIRSFEVHSPHREMNKAQNNKKNAFNVYCLTEKKKKNGGCPTRTNRGQFSTESCVLQSFIQLIKKCSSGPMSASTG